MAYLVPKSAGDDFGIQRDHCRELLVFWCFGTYKITAMIAKIGLIWISAGFRAYGYHCNLLVFWVFGIFMDEAVIGCRHVFVRMAIIVCGLFSKPLVFWFFGLSWTHLSLDVDMFSCVWQSLYAGYSASYFSSGVLGFLWVQLSLDVNVFSCIWISLVIADPFVLQRLPTSAFILACGLFIKLLVFWSFGIFMHEAVIGKSLSILFNAYYASFMWVIQRATCLVPFGFLMDAAIIGCRQGFIHMAYHCMCVYSANYLYFGPLEYSWMQTNHVRVKEQRLQSILQCQLALLHRSIRFRYCTTYWTLPFIASAAARQQVLYLWCRQVLSRLIVVLVVDNPFNGYPATHACYWWIISATSKKQQRATEPTSLASATFIDPLVVLVIGKLISRFSSPHVSYGCITSATDNNVASPFGAVKVYPSLMAFIIKYRLAKRLSELVTGSTSLQQGMCSDYWVASNIVDPHMTPAKYCFTITSKIN
ncbi:hypothetical protein O0I10_005517 [Lichtheimia ornata]|uniref:Uncharacterized protein n=1 Tax=Lichtheimia ornata TaxID=688661 RepID=A0AAD7XZK8_9FUNG|nr:uncharacterized protein O0I10_005517 [Lichtheimia ornata]KAJ8658791.1 hypothetical protein O0I10_005517 [Lichtheimia ornata]